MISASCKSLWIFERGWFKWVHSEDKTEKCSVDGTTMWSTSAKIGRFDGFNEIWLRSFRFSSQEKTSFICTNERRLRLLVWDSCQDNHKRRK